MIRRIALVPFFASLLLKYLAQLLPINLLLLPILWSAG